MAVGRMAGGAGWLRVVVLGYGLALGSLAQGQGVVDSLWKDASKLLGPRSATERALLNELKSITEATIASRNDSVDTEGKVVLYTASWCGFSTKMRNYLRSRNVDFVEFDTQKSERGRREFAQLKEPGVPVTLVGDKKVRGFDPALFDRAYAEYLSKPKTAQASGAAPAAGGVAVAQGGEVGGVLRARIAGVKLRAEADRSAAVVGTLDKGQEVVGLGEERNGFVRVQGAEGEGWVERALLER